MNETYYILEDEKAGYVGVHSSVHNAKIHLKSRQRFYPKVKLRIFKVDLKKCEEINE